jgi:hypothetical protein
MMEECVRVVPTPGNCSMAMTLLNDTRQRANPFQRIFRLWLLYGSNLLRFRARRTRG